MASLALDLVAGILAVLVVRLPVTGGLGLLAAVMLLVPSDLVVPHLHASSLTVDHVVVLALALRVVLMLRTGELTREHFRATPVHCALALLVVAWVAAGVVFAPETAVAALQRVRLVNLAAAITVFVVGLALLRALDRPWFPVQLLTTLLGLAAVIAVVEHVTGRSYGNELFRLVGQAGTGLGAHVLETRAGHVRVRSSGQFALAFAWVAVMLLPLATVLLGRRRWRVLGIAAMGLAAVAVYWTYTRSAAVAVPAVLVLLALTARTRRLAWLGAAVAVAAAVTVVADPAIRNHLSLTTDQGAVSIRFQRLPLILAAIAPHAVGGLGFGGLEGLGVPTTDNFYLLTYGSTGVIGAAALVALLCCAAAQSGRGLRLHDPHRRMIAAAAFTGLVAFAVSGLFEDALFVTQPAQLAFFLLAVATATAEPELGPARLPKISVRRLALLTAVGAAAGGVAFAAVSPRVHQERLFTTETAFRDAGFYDPVDTGHSLIVAVCEVAEATVASTPGTTVSCRDNFTAAGEGTLRVEAPSRSAVLAAYDDISARADRASYLRAYRTRVQAPPESSRPTGWRTAPVSGAAAGFAAGILLPLPWRRRRRRLTATLPAPAA